MAIRRLDPKAVFKVISEYDDAIDHDKMPLDESGKNPVWTKYLETLDASLIPIKEGKAPSLFHIRPLLNTEMSVVTEKYVEVDTMKKRVDYKNRSRMMLEMFDIGVVGLEDGGKVAPVRSDEVEYIVAVSIGSLVSILTNSELKLKKA